MKDSISTPIGIPQFVTAPNSSFAIHPTQTSLSDGTIVLVWAQNGDNRKDIFAQFIGADGIPTGDPFIVNTTTLSDQVRPAVIGLDNGNFVVTWQSFGQDDFVSPPPFVNTYRFAFQYGVYQQIFDPTGTPIGDETLVNTFVDGNQAGANITSLEDGGYIVSWFHYNPVTSFERNSRVYYQRYDENGQPVGVQTLLPADFTDPERPDTTPMLGINFASLSDGNLVASWRGVDADGVFLTVFEPDGTLISQFAIEGSRHGGYVELIGLPDGNIFVVVNAATDFDRSDISLSGVFFDPNGNVVVPRFDITPVDGTPRFVNDVLTYARRKHPCFFSV